MAVCEQVPSATPTGSVSCERERISASQPWCDAELSCSQDVQVGDLPVHVTGGYIRVSCENYEDTYWDCYCEGGSAYVSFDVEGDDGIRTCADASEECLNLIDLDGVMNGGGGGSEWETDIDWDIDIY